MQKHAGLANMLDLSAPVRAFNTRPDWERITCMQPTLPLLYTATVFCRGTAEVERSSVECVMGSAERLYANIIGLALFLTPSNGSAVGSSGVLVCRQEQRKMRAICLQFSNLKDYHAESIDLRSFLSGGSGRSISSLGVLCEALLGLDKFLHFFYGWGGPLGRLVQSLRESDVFDGFEWVFIMHEVLCAVQFMGMLARHVKPETLWPALVYREIFFYRVGEVETYMHRTRQETFLRSLAMRVGPLQVYGCSLPASMLATGSWRRRDR